MPATPAQNELQAAALRSLARVHGELVAWKIDSPIIAVEFANGRACVLDEQGMASLLPNGSLSAAIVVEPA